LGVRGRSAAAQRPSWNYRKEDDGGIIVDMLCHWRYVLDHLFDGVKSVAVRRRTHIPERFDEDGKGIHGDCRRCRVRDVRTRNGVIAQINSRGARACAATICDVSCRRHVGSAVAA
jgi:predicted dehydrogenase